MPLVAATSSVPERTSARPAAVHHLRQRRRRQEHADRPPAVRRQGRVRRTSWRRSTPTPALQRAAATCRLSRCWSTACRPSASRASPSTSPTASSRPTRRQFIVADTPGHEQYTRNMATGASTADLAVILIDATQGRAARRPAGTAPSCRCWASATSCWPSTRWTWSATAKDRFAEIVDGLRDDGRAARLQPRSPPSRSRRCSATTSSRPSAAMPWYAGPTLMHHLETVSRRIAARAAPFRLAVQWINRDGSDFRGYAGTVLGGSVRSGRRDRRLPSGASGHVDAHRHLRRRSRPRRSPARP